MENLETQKTQSIFGRTFGAIKVILGCAVIFIGAQIAAAIFIGIFLGAVNGYDATKIESLFTDSTLLQFCLVLLIESLVVGGVWVALRLKKLNLVKSLNLKKPTLSLLWKTLKIFLLYLLFSWLVLLLSDMLLPKVDVNLEQDIGFKGASGWQLVIVFLALCVAVPIGEEIMFRGLLFKGLKRYLGFVLAAGITTILFGLAHLEFIGGKPLNWAAGIDTAVLSVFLIKHYQKTKTITAPILLHSFKNSLAFVFLFLVK